MIKKKIFLIDGSSYLYRAFYAIASLSNSKGLPTNAIYGFTTMLLKLMKVEHPEYLGICFDLPAPTFRHQEFVEYKAQRKPTPEDLIVQIPWIKKVVQTMGIQTIEVAGYEADDIMGTLAKRGEQGQFQVILVTGDKDMLQLVNPNISVLRMHRGEEYLYDETKTIEKYGVPPAKFPDLVGLMGDSSDNIPGVPGIGEKTASRLIQEYGDLDTVLNHIEAIKGEKLQMQLRTYRDQAILSRRLATIQTSMDLSLTLDDLKIQPPKTDSLIALFSELEFHKLLNEIPKDQTKQVIEINYEHILTKEQISVASKAIENAESIAISLATRTDDSVDGLAVSVSNSQNFYFAWNKDTEQVIRDILVSDSIPKIGFNLKHEYINAQKNKIEFHNGIFDIMLAAYLITPEQSALTLPQLTLTYLHRQLSAVTPTDELALTSATNMQSLIGQTQAICELKTVFDKQLKEKQLQSLFQDIEMPLVKILAEMELTGITIDVDYFADLSRQFESGLSHLSHEIYQYAGEEFNINSPKQLSYILFEKLKLPVKKKTKTGYSTNVDVLEELAIQHQLPAKILEYRTLSKMKSTYVDALLQLVEPKTDLLHSSFNQAGTATGRFSSSDPNLQNLPAQGDWADKIRAGFIPRDKKNVFLSADYSQIELRILAHLSQDETLTHIFANGEDIHTETAVEIFNVLPGMVTSEMRRAAKVVNFGIIYGLSPFGLAQSLKISREEARAYIDRYFARYPGVQEYIAKTIATARETGYVTTLFNRRRVLPDINSPNRDLREFSERAAINTPIQGTAADLLKLAMRNVYRKMKQEQVSSLLLLTIHDELVFEVPPSELDLMRQTVQQELENVVTFSVPILVNIKVGKNLAEC